MQLPSLWLLPNKKVHKRNKQKRQEIPGTRWAPGVRGRSLPAAGTPSCTWLRPGAPGEGRFLSRSLPSLRSQLQRPPKECVPHQPHSRFLPACLLPPVTGSRLEVSCLLLACLFPPGCSCRRTRTPAPRFPPCPRQQGTPGPRWALRCSVAQSCPALDDPMDCSLPASSVHGILQARILE